VKASQTAAASQNRRTKLTAQRASACSATKITPHISGLLLVIHNFLFGKNVLCHNFGELLLGEIFNNTNIHSSFQVYHYKVVVVIMAPK
uniref:Uncharacterized protein n=1 Tax=Sparus aurata TaxID=8175 RepID=A0A671XN15_SPAAU